MNSNFFQPLLRAYGIHRQAKSWRLSDHAIPSLAQLTPGQSWKILGFPKTPSDTLGTLDKELTKKIKTWGAHRLDDCSEYVHICALVQEDLSKQYCWAVRQQQPSSPPFSPPSPPKFWGRQMTGYDCWMPKPIRLQYSILCAYTVHHELRCIRLIPVLSECKCLHTLMHQRCMAVHW